ncbi:MAG: hypothetical protein IPJ82_17220 [Lewinellaceae bacterium]|nr:hypothetical protein [Lewinellaceae bacterium]
MALLRAIYPTIDWSKVTFYDRLPWWVTSGTNAITLPAGIDKIHIYFGTDEYDPCACRKVGIIVHESCHVLQYQQTGPGFGFARPFMMQYLACSLIYAYEDIPFEVEAYDIEGDFIKCYCDDKYNIRFPVCVCRDDNPTFDRVALLDFMNNCGNSLVKTSSSVIYNCGQFNYAIGIILSLLITVLKPLVSLLGFVLGNIFYGIMAGLACLFEWLGISCAWVTKVEKQCSDWATSTRDDCTQYRDDGYNACSEYKDNGYNACSEYKDNGYNACNEYRDDGYNACCTWWPCSWGCKAWYWVANVVCVAWYWVANVVCVAWYWVANVVCVAWYWVANVVCVAWVTVVSVVCTAFTWVLKKILVCS